MRFENVRKVEVALRGMVQGIPPEEPHLEVV
jgi:hypothetical protein